METSFWLVLQTEISCVFISNPAFSELLAQSMKNVCLSKQNTAKQFLTTIYETERLTWKKTQRLIFWLSNKQLSDRVLLQLQRIRWLNKRRLYQLPERRKLFRSWCRLMRRRLLQSTHLPILLWLNSCLPTLLLKQMQSLKSSSSKHLNQLRVVFNNQSCLKYRK